MIGEIQKEVLKGYINNLATDRGVTIHPLLMNEVLNTLYSSSNRQPGEPFTFPFRQPARSVFDVSGFNQFFEYLKIDVDTLFKMAIRARIEARRILLLNDIRMRGYQDRIGTLTDDANNFNNRTITTEGIHEAIFSVPIKFNDYYFRDVNKPLEVDTLNGVLTLPLDPSYSKIVDLSFLKNNPSSIKVETQVNLSELVNDRSSSDISNIRSSSASPWVHNVSINSQRPTISIRVLIELPNIEEINRIDVEPVPGGYQTVVVEGALVAENYLPLGIITYSKGQFITMPVQKLKRLRFTITNTPYNSTANGSDFMFGLRSLRIVRNVYNPIGEAIFRDINPFIAEKTIISAALEANGSTPAGTQITYAIRKSGPGSFTETQGTNIGSSTVFNVAKTFDSGMVNILRSPFTLCQKRNSVEFNTILPVTTGGSSLIPSNIKILDRYMEVRPGQNGFKKINNPAYTVIEIEDARIQFSGDNVEVPIIAPIVLTDQPLRTSSTHQKFIQLPIPAAFNTMAPGAGTDIVSRMKTESYGVFRVEVYDTLNPSALTDITSSCSVSGNILIVSGSFNQKQSFKVHYLGVIDNTVHIKPETLLLHNNGTYGPVGVKPENVIGYNLNLYHLNDRNNKVYSTKLSSGSNSLSNTARLINFTGIFLTPKIDLYESYVTFADNTIGLKLVTPIEADSEYGEYATLRSLSSGALIRLEKKTSFTDIMPGDYLLSVASKPLRYIGPGETPQTLFQSLLAATVDQTAFVDSSSTSDVKFPKLFSMLSRQQLLTRVCVSPNALTYRTLSSFLNRSTRLNNTSYSTALVDGATQIVVAKPTDEVYYVDGTELVVIKFMYFDKDEYNNQGTLDLRIRMESLSNQKSLSTPEISELKFKVRYI